MTPPRTLVIMAAGLGSRYGGIKQIVPVGPSGELIIDYSSYDALAAGFERIIFVITHDIEGDFRDVVGRGIERWAWVEYAFQSMDDLPRGYSLPSGRTKPWGTVQAVLAAKAMIDAPFAVINADDYYGPRAFIEMSDWLAAARATSGGAMRHSMVAYRAEHTLSGAGGVTRGVCTVGEDDMLVSVKERRGIVRVPGGARYRLPDGSFETISGDTLVSMNFWGLDSSFIAAAEEGFPKFLDRCLASGSDGEYLLPDEIDAEVSEGRAEVRVLRSEDDWYGVTYREDRQRVVDALASMHGAGLYRSPLWVK